MTLTIQPQTKTEQFVTEIVYLKNLIKDRHDMLMKLWEKSDEDVVEILTGLGTDCLSVFTLSYQLQVILKTADPAYEIVYPYHWKMIETQTVDEEGNPATSTINTKVLLDVSFKPDRSFESLTDK